MADEANEEKVKLARYDGQDDKFKIVITEYNRMYALLLRPDIRKDIKRKIFTNCEARVLSILRTGLDGGDYEKKWVAANLSEINNIFCEFDSLREKTNIPRPEEVKEDMNKVKIGARAAKETYFKGDEIRSNAGSSAAKLVGLIAGGTAVTATGFSAFSFFGGPIVGGAVTGGTALVGGIATGVAVKIAYDNACEKSEQDTEKSIRKQFPK